MLPTITPDRAAQLIKQGAILVDIREPDEHARERIPGAKHQPLSKIDAGEAKPLDHPVVIFHCKSGARTGGNVVKLKGQANYDAYILEGGLEAWRKAGLPTALDRSQPIDLMRQVQIAAGSLVLLGAVLGFFVAPAFYGLSAFVGAGLVFAGVSGFCTLARLLALMPWNRRAAAV